MTDETLPDPLVPAEVDLRGFSGFMLDVDRLLASELVAIGTPEECWAAMMLWCRAWKQSPPGSLPDDDRVLKAFSGAGSRWTRVRAMALRGFVKCSDGRLYHRTLAEEVMHAWDRRVEHRETVDNKTERQRRWRERLKAVSARLREMRIAVPAGASLETMERLLRDAEASTVPSTHSSTVDDGVGVYVGVSETGKTGTGTGTGTGTVKPKSKTAEPPSADAARPPRPTDAVKDEIWHTGKAILEAEGMTRDRAGSYLGRLCKDFGNLLVLQAVRDCQATAPAKPSEWLMARCQERRSRAGETLGERNARAVADWIPPEMRDAAS